MKCREFEDGMFSYFNETEVRGILAAIDNGDFSCIKVVDRKHQDMLNHLKGCDECQLSIWQYFRIRGKIDYREYPCFHLAFYCNDKEQCCIIYNKKLFQIPISSEGGVVIGHCPWCGIPLKTGYD
jgi:hypothetical protein